MRAEAKPAESFTIYDAPGLDPVNVVLQDLGVGSGRLFVECFGATWSHYWGAMGDRRIREFVLDTSPDYLVCKLLPYGERRITKSEEKYLGKICTAVLDAMRAGVESGVSRQEGP